MGITCEFTVFTFEHAEDAYGCLVVGKQTPENRDLELAGKHLNRRGNNHVIHVKFQNCTIVRIPEGLLDNFPNLISLTIVNSRLKRISKCDLDEYKSLKMFICRQNELEYLPGDLFADLKNLEFIGFNGNNLQVIEPNILDRLNKLQHVNFRNNPNYDKCYSIYPVHEPNASLEEVKAELCEKFMSRFKFLDDLKKSERNLQIRHLELVQSKNDLALQVQNMTGQLTTVIMSLKNNIKRLEAKQDIQPFQTKDIKALLQDETTKDFQITIDGHEFPVHKFLLAARSPTLAELLKNNPEVENLNLVDISVEIFEKILKFLYTDELPGDDGTNFLHLFAAAGKLKIKELRKFAGNKVIEQIDEDNAIDIFKLGFKYDNAEIMQKAFDKIKEKYPKIIFKDEWAVDPDKVIKIIEIFKKKEEAMRKIEEEFEKSLNLNL